LPRRKMLVGLGFGSSRMIIARGGDPGDERFS